MIEADLGWRGQVWRRKQEGGERERDERKFM